MMYSHANAHERWNMTNNLMLMIIMIVLMACEVKTAMLAITTNNVIIIYKTMIDIGLIKHLLLTQKMVVFITTILIEVM